MATVSDINITPRSGLNHIDALLDKGPDWNFLPNAGSNTILYTFSITSGNEAGKAGQEAFTTVQQAAARTIFAYLQQETGIQFVETTSGTGAQIHLANMNLQGSNVTGLCSWGANYSYTANDTLANYSVNAYVYLDNVEFRSENRNLVAGTQGYQTLLHELGHALGLKHPFYESSYDDPTGSQITLAAAEDNTSNTLMSYTHVGAPQSTFSPYDIAALNWLYGRDGLGGALGVGSTTGARYLTGSNKTETLTGTQFNDTFQGNGGNDMIYGGDGTDTVIFSGNRNTYSFTNLSDGSLAVAGAEGTSRLQSIEVLQFVDMSVARADVVDTTAPSAPSMAVSMNSSGYSKGNTPIINGSAEAGSTVKVYINDQLVATAIAGADNLWTARSTVTLADGLNYRATATATDAAGNVSAASTATTFHVDATPPAVPTLSGMLASDGNQPVFSGTGEAGSTIQIFDIDDSLEIGRTVVGADGRWQVNSPPLPNGNYRVSIASLDKADNATASANTLTMTINNPLNQTGDAANNTFTAAPGNAAIDGGGGRDTFVVNGVSDNFAIDRGVYGVTVFDKTGQTGTDNLINVERIKFNDTMVALDIDGNAGQIYRLYQAAYDRVPDQPGLKYWIDAMDTGNYTLTQISNFFIDQKETVDIYGANPSNRDFVYKLYNHVLHREPEPEGANWWIERMDANVVTRAQTLEFFSEGFENKAQVIGSIENGIEYPLA
jgi:hypothetical protein